MFRVEEVKKKRRLMSRVSQRLFCATHMMRPTASATVSSRSAFLTPFSPGAISETQIRTFSSPSITQPLSWTTYFNFKSQLKTYERAASIAGFVSFFSAGSFYFLGVADFDPTDLYFGVMDPSFAYSIGALGVGVLGAVAGTFAGSAVWRGVTNKNILIAIDAKDKEFFQRIQKFRPQGQLRLSVDNPMPDYYGESIKSVQGYRAWLRKQRNYRIKTEGFHARKSMKRKTNGKV